VFSLPAIRHNLYWQFGGAQLHSAAQGRRQKRRSGPKALGANPAHGNISKAQAVDAVYSALRKVKTAAIAEG
jgi:hypothetical protein